MAWDMPYHLYHSDSFGILDIWLDRKPTLGFIVDSKYSAICNKMYNFESPLFLQGEPIPKHHFEGRTLDI